MLRDILKFQAFLEMFSYCKDLKRYRPPLRIQTFIDNPAYTPAHKKKRSQLIRDWFKLVLWYVRLRKAARGQTPYKLLEIEEAIQSRSLQNALMKAKRASAENYQPYFGSDDEDSAITPGGGVKEEGKPSETEIDDMEEFEK